MTKSPSTSPRVSVVIPSYNSEKFIGLTIESVLRQTYSDWELVILDDGSRDRTVEIVRSYAERDARIHVHPRENGGVAAARNRGFAETDPGSEFVTFLDNDDIWEPDALAVMVDALDANPNCAAVHGLAQSMNEHGAKPDADNLEEVLRARRAIVDGRRQDWPVHEPTTFAALAVHNHVVSPGASLMRRSAFMKVQGFDSKTVPCDDWDIALRISRVGDYAFVNRVVMHWRRHSQAASDLSSRWRQAYIYTRLKTMQSSDNTPEQRQIARLVYRLTCADMRTGAWEELRRKRIGSAIKRFARWMYYYGAYLGSSIVGYPRNERLATDPRRDKAIAH